MSTHASTQWEPNRPTANPRLIRSKLFGDHRGWFNEIYSTDLSRAEGLLSGIDFIQDNASLSGKAGTLRGLHFQLPPAAQGKLVMVLSGAIYDVAVDIRRSSPNFGRYEGVELRAGTGHQFYVPEGFAHGFMTLEPNTVVFYKVTSLYAPALDRGIAWDDSDIGIAWPLPVTEVELSDKDRKLPRLKDATELFA